MGNVSHKQSAHTHTHTHTDTDTHTQTHTHTHTQTHTHKQAGRHDDSMIYLLCITHVHALLGRIYK